MLNNRAVRTRTAVAALFISLMAASAPALAQAIPGETPDAALSRHIRVLASTPNDFNALIGAGRAALELGDTSAAIGFFGRAEEANPQSPAPKIGMGSAMAMMDDPQSAIFYFEQASRLGAAPMAVALDRGLARDLMGELSSAQADYRLAISAMGSDEARRRLALSLAIARDRKGALDALQPLLNRRDPAAQRTRAFVLALVGDKVAATQAIESVMPGASARFEPFFRYLPNLSTVEKAAAVHLGIFPGDASSRVASIDQAPVTIASATPPPAPVVQQTPTVKKVAQASPQPRSPAPSTKFSFTRQPLAGSPVPAKGPSRSSAPSGPPASPPASSLTFTLPSASSAPPTALASPAPVQEVTAAPPREQAAAEPAFSIAQTAEAEGRLSGIDKLLATIADAPPPPPAPKPRVETKKPVDKAAAIKAAADKKKKDEQLAAEKKAREDAAKLGVPGTNWVQLAGGAHSTRMASEYKRLSAKAGSLLKSRTPYVTEGVDYFRLLVGPFDSKADAQAFVNKLAKEGVDGFSWTRTPPKIKIEKLK